MIAIENLLLHLASGGRLNIVVPARVAFVSGSVKELREFVQNMYCLKEIDALPDGVFKHTGIKTLYMSITTGRTEDVEIKRMKADTDNARRDGINNFIVEDDTFVMIEELQEMGDWNIDKIFAMQDEDFQRFKQSNVKKAMLGEVADIFRGKNVTKKDQNGSIGFVNISNLGEHSIITDGMDHINEEPRKVANYLLEDGDVLLPARGTAMRIVLFEKQSYPCIASSNVVIVRPHENEMSPAYLKLFLDSPTGRKMLEATQQGSSVMNISYKDLRSMEVPLPPIEEQKKIAEEYEKELQIYNDTVSQAEERWQGVLNKLQKKF